MNKNPKIYEKNPNPKEINKVVSVLKEGGLAIIATDSVYAFACDMYSTKALQRMAKIKNMKLEKAKWSFLCEDLSDLSKYTHQISNSNFKLLKHYLPGPFTFILPASKNLPSIFKKKKTIGLRIPESNICKALISALGNPIISSSLKDEDEIIEYTTDPELIYEKWHKKVDIIINAGYGSNIPSTVIDLTGDEPVVVRQGKGKL